jgi:hypothetical protein
MKERRAGLKVLVVLVSVLGSLLVSGVLYVWASTDTKIETNEKRIDRCEMNAAVLLKTDEMIMKNLDKVLEKLEKLEERLK